MSYSIRVINEYDGGKVYNIEKQCRTYGQVLKELEAEGVKTHEIQLCDAKKDSPAFSRLSETDDIPWGDETSLKLYAYEKEYAVRVTTYVDNGVSSAEKTEVFNLLKSTTIAEVREMFDKLYPGCLQEINYGRQLEGTETLESLDEGFLENPVLVGKISINVADEKCNQMRHLAVSPHSSVKSLWMAFMEKASPPRVLHSRETAKGRRVPLCREEGCDGRCPHTWLCHAGKFLLADDTLAAALDLLPDETQKIVYYAPPPFTVTIKEKNEKNEIIETKIEIEDSNTIGEVRNKYSRNAEEGLVDGDLLLLDDQDLKEERMVFTYMIRSHSALFVQKRSANQAMFTYICADCGNDLRLRKDEKIRCRECGHRVVYKPRLNKPLQHFAR